MIARRPSVNDRTNRTDSPDSALAAIALGALGGLLFAAGGRRRSGSALLQAAGLALIGVAAQPIVERAVRRAGERRRIIKLSSEIEIERPVAEIFTFFKNFENFPRVIGGLHSVVDYEDGRSHWESYTPSGEVVSWDAVVTKYVPNHVIAWESVPRSPVEVRGLIRFTAVSPTRTKLQFEFAHTPSRTRWSDAVRALLGPAPQKQLVNDLNHARFYLESLPTQTAEVVASNAGNNE